MVRVMICQSSVATSDLRPSLAAVRSVECAYTGHWHYYESLWPTVSTNQPFGLPNTSMTPPLPTKRSFVDPDATVYLIRMMAFQKHSTYIIYGIRVYLVGT